jgi:hypothetical protein
MSKRCKKTPPKRQVEEQSFKITTPPKQGLTSVLPKADQPGAHDAWAKTATDFIPKINALIRDMARQFAQNTVLPPRKWNG